jgi:hypothetical protein
MSLLKNLTNIFIIAGDYVMMGRTYTWHVYACLLLMLATAAGGAATDAAFSPAGYAWQLLNCLLTGGWGSAGPRLAGAARRGGRAQSRDASRQRWGNLGAPKRL